MKFDVLSQREIPANEHFLVETDRIRLRTSQPCNLYIEVYGCEALAESGQSFDVTVTAPVHIRVEGPKNTRAFLEMPRSRSYTGKTESFTDANGMPLETGSLLAVKEAVRKFQLEQRNIQNDLRRQLAAKRLTEKPDPEPVIEQPETAEKETEATGTSE